MSNATARARGVSKARSSERATVDNCSPGRSGVSPDQLNQVTIRCVADRQMAFIVAAGNHRDLHATET